MNTELNYLLITAASLGFVHTLLGPDHYLPFIGLAKARNWNTKRTISITALCGLGHVGSSIVLGLIGVAMGYSLNWFEPIDSVRGDMAAWLLITFGLLYGIWGLRKVFKKKAEKVHQHLHDQEHIHTHNKSSKRLLKRFGITPWVLFIIFVLGPCEPFIPILIYPASTESALSLILVISTFSVVTIATMITLVMVAVKGLNPVRFKKIEPYSHVLAGGIIFLSGVGIVLGL